ncbi:FAD synthetase [Bacillus sp. Soil768D1]|nr:FAD synthetase [Bacillus sp. Soil768D1]
MEMHAEEFLKRTSSVIAIGAFDGVHQGHQAVIKEAVNRAKILGVPSLVYTFDPPPRSYFQGVSILTTVKEKLVLLEELGVDHVVIARFDEFYTMRRPSDFIEDLKRFNPLEIIVGNDFRFGGNREGNIQLLEQNFQVRVKRPICCSKGQVISSTRIRQLISQGDFQQSFSLLGRLPSGLKI